MQQQALINACLIVSCLIGSCLIVAIGGCATGNSAVPNTPAASTKATVVNAVLNSLHSEASAANFDKYFALYTEDAVFLGTDRAEYWPIEAFREYTRKHFDAGNGWTYTPINRELHFYADTAWFEEELHSANYGQVRGTGVLVNTAAGWKVAQYNLTLPIPNEMFRAIANDIKAHYAQEAQEARTPPAEGVTPR